MAVVSGALAGPVEIDVASYGAYSGSSITGSWSYSAQPSSDFKDVLSVLLGTKEATFTSLEASFTNLKVGGIDPTGQFKLIENAENYLLGTLDIAYVGRGSYMGDLTINGGSGRWAGATGDGVGDGLAVKGTFDPGFSSSNVRGHLDLNSVVNPVPEPFTMMLGVGALGAVIVRRKRTAR